MSATRHGRPLSERNAAIVAHRQAPPKLPPGWGSSFAMRPRYLGEVADAAPRVKRDRLEELGILATGASYVDRVLSLLRALASHGLSLPRNADMERALGGEELCNSVGKSLKTLIGRGEICLWSAPAGPHEGGRAILILASGSVLLSPLVTRNMVSFA